MHAAGLRPSSAGWRAVPALLLAALFLAAPPASAEVAGPCSNCHTMHNSQNAEPMAWSYSGASKVADSTPNSHLLVTDCLGCHTASDGATWKDAVTGAPIVFSMAEPGFGASSDGGTTRQGLAAGNFYWVTQDDSFGHNIMSDDATLNVAPGDQSGCGNDSCHVNLDRGYTGSGHLQGRSACLGCHLVSGGSTPSVTSWHHAKGSTGLVDSAAKGWYRFLGGHEAGDGRGVSGIEDADWERIPTSSDHNEYLGRDGDKTGRGGFAVLGNTMTGFCTGCHGNFHVQDTTVGGSSPWLRHPSDAPLPSSGEFASYVTYDPLVPVARPVLSGVSSTVTPGADMVMCLSCHRAHASPYFKMLRWDIRSANLATALAGCGVCHTRKR
ncbi:MAG: cytochrome c3 family protein [Thermodesulfobacteriota bacterium]